MSKFVADVLAATPLQEGLLALHQLSTTSDPYHVQFIFRITGALDESLLQQCAELMLERHPNLKAAFYNTDVPHPVQIIPTTVSLDWQIINREDTVTDTTDVDALAMQFAQTDFAQPFDLTNPAPLRLRLLRWAETDHHLVLTAHHIIIDGWSAPLFFAELTELYRLQGHAELLAKPLAYRNYIAWLAGKSREEGLAAWKTELGVNPTPCLVAPQASTTVGSPPQIFEDHLTPSETVALQTWCRTHGVTVSNAVLFAWAVVLGSLVDRDEVITGTVVSGRPADLLGAESMIGLFINTVPARILLHPAEDAASQVQKLHDSLLRTKPHEYIGLSEIQRHLKTRDLFDTLVVYQNTPRGSSDDPGQSGIAVTPLATNDSTHYPLTIVPAVVDDVLRVKVEARSDLINHGLPTSSSFIATAIASLLRSFPTSDGTALAQLGTGLPSSQLPLVPAYTPHTLPQLMQKLVAENPDAPAVIDSNIRLTRREFLNHSLNIAAMLMKANLVPGDRIGVLLPRTVSQPAALLACAWTGITAVQLDMNAPMQHNINLAKQASAVAILSDTPENYDLPVLVVPPATAEGVVTQVPAHNELDTPLYIVFTSGSTGKPKGVVGTNRGIASLIAAHNALIWQPYGQQLQRRLTVGHAWSMAFDASWQPLTALFSGHTVAILSDSEIRYPEAYLQALQRYQVDMIETSPTMFGHLEPAGLVQKTTEWNGLAVLGLGGEAIDPAVWSRLAKSEYPTVHNFYGPTETTVDALTTALANHEEPSIGTPLPGFNALLLDRWLRPVPVGVPGELYLSGPQVALGYNKSPELTACNFVATAAGKRAYRTGDIAVINPHTNALTYLGRADDQLKIRGHRVELGHVLQTVMQLEEVADARVHVLSAKHNPRIIAIVIPHDHSLLAQPNATATQLMATLRQTAPAHLLPATIIPLAEFPMTANGKIDLTALPDVADQQFDPPQGETETQLSALITQLIDVDTIDRNTDIRDLGIDSILLLQLSSKAASSTHSLLQSLTPRIILSAPTVRGIAANLESGAILEETPDDRTGSVRPTPVQQWLIDTGAGNRFCQWAIVEVPTATTADEIHAALAQLVYQHELLRATLDRTTNTFTVPTESTYDTDWLTIDLTVTPEHLAAGDLSAFKTSVAQAIDKIDPTAGRMLQAVWLPKIGRFVLLIHHFAVDSLSWRIILSDLVTTPTKQTTSFRRWSQLLEQRKQSLDIPQLRTEWENYLAGHYPGPLGARAIDPTCDLAAEALTQTVITSADTLLTFVDSIGKGSSGKVGLREVLLSLLAKTLHQWRGATSVAIDLEGHGRDLDVLTEQGHPGDDLSQTIGWFTTITPTLLPSATTTSLEQLSYQVAASLAAQPSSPVDYSLACQISTGPAEIEVNYLGRLDLGHDLNSTTDWAIAQEHALYDALPEMPDPLLPRTYAMEITFSVIPSETGPKLSTHFNLAAGVFTEQDLHNLSDYWSQAVATIDPEAEQDKEPH